MSSKKCTLQHQQHGQKMAAKQSSQATPSTPPSGATGSLSLADQLNIFRVLSNHSAAPNFQVSGCRITFLMQLDLGLLLTHYCIVQT